MAGVEVVVGCVVDVDQDGVVAVWGLGAEGVALGDQGEEVVVDQAASGVGGQFAGVGEEILVVPGDHVVEGFDDV